MSKNKIRLYLSKDYALDKAQDIANETGSRQYVFQVGNGQWAIENISPAEKYKATASVVLPKE